ncbi:YheC/YheD family protein [Bacillus sp. FJAT-28004]|uniref:YheC/YheD family protein n=1 Tax=Bacillus sp. FJAT-28004 TaxID=1679165 RepID=UPI0006B681F9|nr:YheC/YheD family protein [Bacillus sp. FJAT-28004]
MYKKKYASRNIRGKLRVCKYLSANKKLKRYVPQTVSFNRDHLQMMLSHYDTIYVKPDVGSLGMGIFKLERVDSGYELYSIVKKKQIQRHYHSVSDVYKQLKREKSSKLIIQKGISLDQVNGCPYDIRAMVQRKPKGKWVCTGFMVKVGAHHKIVTNYYQGGAIYSMKKLGAKQGLSTKVTNKRIRRLSIVALKISQALSKKRSGMHEFGIDFAFDKQQHLWVLEVNSNHPQFHPLKKLDPPAYKKMKRFAASYGRHDAK